MGTILQTMGLWETILQTIGLWENQLIKVLHLIHIIADLYKKFQNNLFIFCTSNFFFHLGDWSQPVKAKTITVRDYTAHQNK